MLHAVEGPGPYPLGQTKLQLQVADHGLIGSDGVTSQVTENRYLPPGFTHTCRFIFRPRLLQRTM